MQRLAPKQVPKFIAPVGHLHQLLKRCMLFTDGQSREPGLHLRNLRIKLRKPSSPIRRQAALPSIQPFEQHFLMRALLAGARCSFRMTEQVKNSRNY